MNGLDGQHSWDGDEKSRINQKLTVSQGDSGQDGPSHSPRLSIDYAKNFKALWETYVFPADLFRWLKNIGKPGKKVMPPPVTSIRQPDSPTQARRRVQTAPAVKAVQPARKNVEILDPTGNIVIGQTIPLSSGQTIPLNMKAVLLAESIVAAQPIPYLGDGKIWGGKGYDHKKKRYATIDELKNGYYYYD